MPHALLANSGKALAGLGIEAGPVLPAGLKWLPWLVLGAVLTEALVRTVAFDRDYDWRAFGVTLADAVMRQLALAAGLSLSLPALAWAWQHRLTTLPLTTMVDWGLLLLGEELCYYAYHRCAHRVAWFWATHCVHHSPRQLTLAAALRLGVTGPLTGTGLFFAPLVWIGYPPTAVALVVGLNLFYQFWLHAPWMPRLGPLEWVLNTPAHHRVHHASNPAYLDCNYGGMLIVFDRCFGTLVLERADTPPRYGLTVPLTGRHPLRVSFHGWIVLWRQLRKTQGWAARARLLVSRPSA